MLSPTRLLFATIAIAGVLGLSGSFYFSVTASEEQLQVSFGGGSRAEVVAGEHRVKQDQELASVFAWVFIGAMLLGIAGAVVLFVMERARIRENLQARGFEVVAEFHSPRTGAGLNASHAGP